MAHTHIYDDHGNQICCLEDIEASYPILSKESEDLQSDSAHSEEHSHDHDHAHDHAHSSNAIGTYLPLILSLTLLLLGLFFDHVNSQEWFSGNVRLLWYIAAYTLVGLPVLNGAIEGIKNGELFSEFTLMMIATIGAFSIGEYPEAVAVMLFYFIGEYFQSMAVKRAKSNISSLLDQRPDEARVIQGNQVITVKAKSVNIGDLILLKPGDKLSLDGELESDSASFNTAALTGESTPDTRYKGDVVLAGMINLNASTLVRVSTPYEDSKLSKILELVQDATKHKAPTELFIRKFARIYTPIVVGLAIAICVLPYFFVTGYQFNDWLYRALVFLVISCPCALVISIPLGYFGGIGAASKQGILIKGSNFLDILAGVQHVIMDKTGTLTAGVFKVKEVHIDDSFDQTQILQLVNALEQHSSHPVATAIYEYMREVKSKIVLEAVNEFAGEGMVAKYQDADLLVGNFRLMDRFGIRYDIDPSSVSDTIIAIAYQGRFAGYITIADVIKPEAADAIQELIKRGIDITMLSGDKETVVTQIAKTLGIPECFGGLLPEDKVNIVKQIVAQGKKVAFVGDGMNDAPVIAVSDVGIAMAGLGSDATIETADVVIQDDKVNKVPIAIAIGKKTKMIVWQNITLAFVVKAVVLILGAGGIATMWEAVFADVGVALLAIFNAVRIQHFMRMK